MSEPSEWAAIVAQSVLDILAVTDAPEMRHSLLAAAFDSARSVDLDTAHAAGFAAGVEAAAKACDEREAREVGCARALDADKDADEETRLLHWGYAQQARYAATDIRALLPAKAGK